MLDFRKISINSALRKVLKRFHYPVEVMLTCVRWYVAYPLSLRHIEEMMQERGVFVDHSTVHRWAVRMLPVLAAVLQRRKPPVGLSWRRLPLAMQVTKESKNVLMPRRLSPGKWPCIRASVKRSTKKRRLMP